MHEESMINMVRFRDKYLADKKGVSILDIGAACVVPYQPTYRQIFEADYRYFGFDIEPCKNVDVVGYENITDVYDVLISGQVLEHIKRPWEWLKALVKYFSLYICIIAPNTHREHRYPLDTYRYYPDGMRDLFEYAGIKEVEIYKYKKDTIGIGTKEEGILK